MGLHYSKHKIIANKITKQDEEIVDIIEISDYNEHVVISQRRRAKIDKKTGKLLNPRSVGTPRLWKING